MVINVGHCWLMEVPPGHLRVCCGKSPISFDHLTKKIVVFPWLCDNLPEGNYIEWISTIYEKTGDMNPLNPISDVYIYII